MDSTAKHSTIKWAAAVSIAVALLATPIAAAAADADAAQGLARQNNYFKCHAIDNKKVGPAWKDVAKQLKGDKDAQAKLIKWLTSGEKDHPVIKSKSADDTKNLVDWILSL